MHQKLPEEKILPSSGVRNISSAPGIMRKYTLLRCSTNDPATA
jgi:hypothetical protein